MKLTSSNERLTSLLVAQRLPARINNEQAAELLGFQPHDIPLLVKAALLKPLGGGPRNSVKFYAASEVVALAADRRWLDKATKAVSRRSATAVETEGASRQGRAPHAQQ